MPKNIDVLLVEQEVVGDDKTALEAVVSANEELVRLRQEAASINNKGDDGDDEDDDAGEKLAELYEQLRLMGSDAAEAQASKILVGLGFTKDMQQRTPVLQWWLEDEDLIGKGPLCPANSSFAR